MDELVRTLGMEGISKSQASRLCGETDDQVQTFLTQRWLRGAKLVVSDAHKG